jgi:hypothetical protein
MLNSKFENLPIVHYLWTPHYQEASPHDLFYFRTLYIWFTRKWPFLYGVQYLLGDTLFEGIALESRLTSTDWLVINQLAISIFPANIFNTICHFYWFFARNKRITFIALLTRTYRVVLFHRAVSILATNVMATGIYTFILDTLFDIWTLNVQNTLLATTAGYDLFIFHRIFWNW